MMVNTQPAYLEHDHKYDTSIEFNDNREAWIENRTQEIVNDPKLDLIDLIADYCLDKLTCWTKCDFVLRKAMEQSPELREFLTKAAKTQAIKDFKSELREKRGGGESDHQAKQ